LTGRGGSLNLSVVTLTRFSSASVVRTGMASRWWRFVEHRPAGASA
jgi:hypothetical protein